MKGNLWKKVALGLAAVGPGLFLIGYNIGTGSVVTMAKAGAEHGMVLLWAVALSCVFTYVLMVAYGKVTIVTGKTALNNYRHFISKYRIGFILAIYVMIALIFGELLSLLGIVGIVTELLQEGTRLLFGGNGLDTFWLTVLMVIGLIYLFWSGDYRMFEKVLTVFVIFMALSFIIVFFLVKPNLGVIAQGLVPKIPKVPGSMGLVAAMAGTTVSAAVFIIRSTVVAEKGWQLKDLAGERKDAAVSAGMMFFLSAMIMAVAAGTLHVMGMKLTNTVELISLFEPLGGRVAGFILILGISAAGISTIFPIVLIAPWLIADFTGQPRDIKSPLFRVLGLGGIFLAFVTQLIDQRPPSVMIFAQAFQAVILPAVVIPVIYLINSKKVMREYTAGARMNLMLVATLTFGLLTSYLAIAEVLH